MNGHAQLCRFISLQSCTGNTACYVGLISSQLFPLPVGPFLRESPASVDLKVKRIDPSSSNYTLWISAGDLAGFCLTSII